MEAKGGDLHMSGSNVNISAGNEMNLEAPKLALTNGKACGTVKITGGTIKHEAVFIKDEITGSVSQNVFGEYTIRQLLDPRASFNLISSGAFNVTAGGDMSVNALARAELIVAGLPAKPIPTAKSPNAFTLTVGTGNSLINFNAGNVTYGVQGNTTGTLSGNNTSTVTGNQPKTISGNHTSTYSGTFNETITGNTTLTNSGTYTQTIAGVHNLTSSAQYTHNITGIASILAGGVMTISGTQINLN